MREIVLGNITQDDAIAQQLNLPLRADIQRAQGLIIEGGFRRLFDDSVAAGQRGVCLRHVPDSQVDRLTFIVRMMPYDCTANVAALISGLNG